jgi:hypothetical protein
MPMTIEARAAQLVDIYLRGYLSRPDSVPLGLDELADIAYVARTWAEREAEEAQQASSACCRQS